MTRGADERALTRPVQQLALAEEIAVLRGEDGWHKSGHSAKTLVKQAGLSVVLIALGAGRRMKEHRAEGSISIHALTGRLQLHVNDETLVLPAGSLLALDRGVPHDVEALEDSSFLLSVCLEPAQAS